jgi:hypothetical protein
MPHSAESVFNLSYTIIIAVALLPYCCLPNSLGMRLRAMPRYESRETVPLGEYLITGNGTVNEDYNFHFHISK